MIPKLPVPLSGDGKEPHRTIPSIGEVAYVVDSFLLLARFGNRLQ